MGTSRVTSNHAPWLYVKMAASTKVAVVTGANKGIGYFVVRRLCREFKGDVILTARNEQYGMEAVKRLEGEECSPKFHQLDITSDESVERLRMYLEKQYGGLDVLVNNAAIAYKNASTAPASEQATVTIDVNFFGTLRVCSALFPLLRPHARVVHVSSRAGRIGIIRSQELQAKFTSPELTEAALCDLMRQFKAAAVDGTRQQGGWPSNSYGTSKVGTTALAKVQARQFAASGKEDILVNACCPGYCKTDMTSQRGGQHADEGAKTVAHLALLPRGAPTGEFWGEMQVIPWDSTI